MYLKFIIWFLSSLFLYVHYFLHCTLLLTIVGTRRRLLKGQLMYLKICSRFFFIITGRTLEPNGIGGEITELGRSRVESVRGCAAVQSADGGSHLRRRIRQDTERKQHQYQRGEEPRKPCNDVHRVTGRSV